MVTANITRSQEEHPELGKISKIEFDNGSSIYISKKGWTFKLPEDEESNEIQVPWSEINLAFRESMIQGYREEPDSPESGSDRDEY